MSEAGNGSLSLLKSITETKERTAAWAMRGLLLAISALGAIALWLAQAQLSDIKTKVDGDNTRVWQAMSRIAENQDKTTVALTRITTSFADHILQFNEMKQQVKDHEAAIQTLRAEKVPR